MRTVEAGGVPIGDAYPPRIMGVVNVSRESPYDPSVFGDAAAAARYVDDELVAEGADIIDVGLESANKRFDVLSVDEELARLETAIALKDVASRDVVWSIETRYHEVAATALEAGFDMVNDVCGFADPKMPEVCTTYDAAVVKMASPPDLERPGALADVEDIYVALTQNGFTEKTIIDPAFGGWSDAKTIDDDHETFDRLREFRGYGRPLLVSINRKNFLKAIAGRATEEALPVSLAATSLAVERGAHIIRTHDVAETRDAARVGYKYRRDRIHEPDVGITELDVATDRELARHLDRIGAINPGSSTPRDLPEVFPHAVEFDLPAAATTYLSEKAAETSLTVFHGDGLVIIGSKSAFRELDDMMMNAPPAAETAVARVCSALTPSDK